MDKSEQIVSDDIAAEQQKNTAENSAHQELFDLIERKEKFAKFEEEHGFDKETMEKVTFVSEGEEDKSLQEMAEIARDKVKNLPRRIKNIVTRKERA